MSKSADEIWMQQLVGAKIKELRKSAALRTADLARQAGISQGQLSKLESGKATLSISTLLRLCKLLNQSLSMLFQGDDEVPRIMGTMTTISTPASQAMDWFAREVRLRTENRMVLIRLRGSQVGSAEEQLEQLRQGVIDLFMGDLSYYYQFSPAVNIINLPFTFSNEGHLISFLESDYCQKAIREPLLAQRIRFLDRRWSWQWGPERVLVANRPIITPEQVRGLRVRVSLSPVERRFWEELGAKPIVLPWPDITPAWSKGQFDVLPAYKVHLFPMGFCRFGRYVTLLGDVCPNLAIAANEAKFAALPSDIQQVLQQTYEDAGDYFRVTVRQAEEENELLNLAKYKAVYMKVDLTPWRTEAARIRRKMIDLGQLPVEAWTEVQSLAREHRIYPKESFDKLTAGGHPRETRKNGDGGSWQTV